MATQENGGIQLETLLTPLPRGFLAQSNTRGAEALGKYLGLEFKTQPKDVILNARNRLLICLFLRDEMPNPWFYFLLGVKRDKMNYGGSYSEKYHATFVWQDDIDCLDAKYLHETTHSYVFQENPSLAKEYLVDREVVEKTRGSDVSLFLIERGIVRSFINEGIAEWVANEILNRRLRSLQGSTPENDELIRQHFSGARSPFSSQEPWLKDIVSIGRERYLEALSLTGKERKRGFDKANHYLRHFYYGQGWVFVRDTLDYMISRGLSSRDALNSLIQGMPERIEQIQDAFDLAESLFH